MWVRGLKHTHVYKDMKYTDVAPYVGAWIETYKRDRGHVHESVAPYVGAWIETFNINLSRYLWISRTLCGCVD